MLSWAFPTCLTDILLVRRGQSRTYLIGRKSCRDVAAPVGLFKLLFNNIKLQILDFLALSETNDVGQNVVPEAYCAVENISDM
ncbi:hypothetical protein CHELA40_13054 [Chelatococcus asaccharovorans]|nr:hypothetical protein CHELA40_13054 [Chelatococcus asaccharovorans]